MAFWGVEVKSGSPFTLKANESSGLRLHLSQATLGHGNGPERSILQCNVGNKSPILLCALSPDKVDSHQLNLEFDEADEVIFSVLGPRSLHLSGYFIDRSTRYFVDKTSEPNDDDKTESYGEDIGYSDMERASSTDDYDYNDSFINDEDSDVPSIDDDEISIKEMENGKGGRLRKKFEVSNSDSAEILASADASSDENYVEVLNNGEYKIPKVRFSKRPIRREDLMRSWKARRSTLEKGEPSAKIENTSEARTHTHKTLDKREDKPLGDDVNLSPVQKGGDVLSKENEKWKNMIECLKNENPTTKKWWNEYSTDVLPSQNGDATLSNKKRTRDMIEETSDVQKNQLECSETKKQAIDKNFEKEAATQKPLESETSSNGVMTEEIEKEKLDGESAVKGKKVSILYTEKLEDTGKLFDSNLGEAPLTCRLGGEEVTEGLSIGVEDVINTNTNTEERLREDVPKNEVEAVKIR